MSIFCVALDVSYRTRGQVGITFPRCDFQVVEVNPSQLAVYSTPLHEAGPGARHVGAQSMKTTAFWYRAANLAATLIFILMAALQLNDPDPLYWFVVYAAVAVVAAAAVVGRDLPRFALVTLGAVIAGALISAPGFIDYLHSGNWGSIAEHMNDEEPYIEQGREFVGLLVAATALLLFMRRSS